MILKMRNSQENDGRKENEDRADPNAVSYTHLDVYKRQDISQPIR